jgi:ABC-type Zn uptake system ZnuABC Zn-binding protein ZnuA
MSPKSFRNLTGRARQRLMIKFGNEVPHIYRGAVIVHPISTAKYAEAKFTNFVERCNYFVAEMKNKKLMPESVDVIQAQLALGYFPRRGEKLSDVKKISPEVMRTQEEAMLKVLETAYALLRKNGKFSIVVDERKVGPNALGILERAAKKTKFYIGFKEPVPENKALDFYTKEVHEAKENKARLFLVELFKE